MSNIAFDKSFDLAVKIIYISKYLCEDKKNFIISKQLLRSGTSIGANIKEGLYRQSKKDFLSKITIALKEAAETEYWLELLMKTNYLDEKKATPLLDECKEIIKILFATVKTTKNTL